MPREKLERLSAKYRETTAEAMRTLSSQWESYLPIGDDYDEMEQWRCDEIEASYEITCYPSGRLVA